MTDELEVAMFERYMSRSRLLHRCSPGFSRGLKVCPYCLTRFAGRPNKTFCSMLCQERSKAVRQDQRRRERKQVSSR